MGANVFGNPVTDDTVKLVYPNLTKITARDRAEVAVQYMGAEEKTKNAQTFVHNLKKAYGTGTATLCMIYNATGSKLSLVLNHTWAGNVWRSPYPDIIQNGQWAAFLHVRGTLWGPSRAAVVYKGTNNDGVSSEWMLAWNTPRMNDQNRVYTEVGVGNGFASANWNTIERSLEQKFLNHSITRLGCYSSVVIGDGSSPEFVGIMSLAGLDARAMAIASDVSIVSPSLDSKYDDFIEGDPPEDADINATPLLLLLNK